MRVGRHPTTGPTLFSLINQLPEDTILSYKNVSIFTYIYEPFNICFSSQQQCFVLPHHRLKDLSLTLFSQQEWVDTQPLGQQYFLLSTSYLEETNLSSNNFSIFTYIYEPFNIYFSSQQECFVLPYHRVDRQDFSLTLCNTSTSQHMIFFALSRLTFINFKTLHIYQKCESLYKRFTRTDLFNVESN